VGNGSPLGVVEFVQERHSHKISFVLHAHGKKFSNVDIFILNNNKMDLGLARPGNDPPFLEIRQGLTPIFHLLP
jgi:hypothetical protein